MISRGHKEGVWGVGGELGDGEKYPTTWGRESGRWGLLGNRNFFWGLKKSRSRGTTNIGSETLSTEEESGLARSTLQGLLVTPAAEGIEATRGAVLCQAKLTGDFLPTSYPIPILFFQLVSRLCGGIANKVSFSIDTEWLPGASMKNFKVTYADSGEREKGTFMSASAFLGLRWSLKLRSISNSPFYFPAFPHLLATCIPVKLLGILLTPPQATASNLPVAHLLRLLHSGLMIPKSLSPGKISFLSSRNLAANVYWALSTSNVLCSRLYSLFCPVPATPNCSSPTPVTPIHSFTFTSFFFFKKTRIP